MNERPGYGDAEAKRIIARAAELDAEQGRQLDATALREIASEAGISPLAVDRALQEIRLSAGGTAPLGSRVFRWQDHHAQRRTTPHDNAGFQDHNHVSKAGFPCGEFGLAFPAACGLTKPVPR